MARVASRIALDHSPSLQDCVNQDPQCKAKLREATQLALSFYNPETMGSRYDVYDKFMVFVTEHYFTAVEESLNDIVYGCCSDDNTMPSGSYVPRSNDAMILLAATRLRCIGLLWGLFEDERIYPRDSEDWKASAPNWSEEKDGVFVPDQTMLQELIRQFSQRSARFLKCDWRMFCSWNDTERRTLASVIEGYFPGADVNMLPTNFAGYDVRSIACLLRLATMTTITPGVCPLEFRLDLKPDEFYDKRETHLSVTNWISAVAYDHARGAIEIIAGPPKPVRIPQKTRDSDNLLPIAYLSYQSGLKFLGSVIQSKLAEIEPCLSECANTRFRQVRVSCVSLEGWIEGEDVDSLAYLPDNWCLCLAAAANASEVAGMVALILKTFCEYGFHDRDSSDRRIPVSFVEQVLSVCTSAEKLHPFNELVRKLVGNIRSWVTWEGEPNKKEIEDFLTNLEEYLSWRSKVGDAAALAASQQNALADPATGKMVDVVVLYSYGRATLSTLLESGFQGRVYLVRMEEEFRGPWVLHETERIVEVLERNNIEHEEVSIGELPPWLHRLRHDEKSFVCLMGTRCILADQANRTFYGPIGVRSLALTVRDMDGRVILVAEEDKVVDDPLICAEYRKKQRLVKPTPQPWTQVDILDEAKHVDVVVIGKAEYDHAFWKPNSRTIRREVQDRLAFVDNAERTVASMGIAVSVSGEKSTQVTKDELNSIPKVVLVTTAASQNVDVGELPIDTVLSFSGKGGWSKTSDDYVFEAHSIRNHDSWSAAFLQSTPFAIDCLEGLQTGNSNIDLARLETASGMREFITTYPSFRAALNQWNQTHMFVMYGVSANFATAFLDAVGALGHRFVFPVLFAGDKALALDIAEQRLKLDTSDYSIRPALFVNERLRTKRPSLTEWLGGAIRDSKGRIVAQRRKRTGVDFLQLKNFGPYEELKIEFDQQLTVFVGNNATGKTSILRAICFALCGIEQSRGEATWFIRSGCDHSRVEVQISGAEHSVDIQKQSLETQIVRSSEPIVSSGLFVAIGFPALRGVRQPNAQGPSIDRRLLVPRPDDLWPLMYGDVDSRFGTIKQWLVDTDFKVRGGGETGERAATIRDLFFDLIDRIHPNSSLRFVRIEETNFQIVMSMDGVEVSLEQLSQGLLSVFGWVGYLLVRLSECYPQSANPNLEYALVMVDEIDSHMHPSWQRTFIPTLMDLFPKIQLVATTHSPLMLASCGGRGKEYRIRRSGSRLEVDLIQEDLRGVGMNGVLTSGYFEMPSAQDVATERLLDEHTELMSKEKKTPQEQRRLRDINQELQKIGFELGIDDPRYAKFLNLIAKERRERSRTVVTADDAKQAESLLSGFLKQLQGRKDE